MEVLSGPWASLALLLQQTFMHPDRQTDSFLFLWVFIILLFITVTLLLLQLIVYFEWKLRQAEAGVMAFSTDRRSADDASGSTNQRKRRRLSGDNMTFGEKNISIQPSPTELHGNLN